MPPCLDQASLAFQCADKITWPTCVLVMLNIGGNQINCGRWIKGGQQGESQGAKPQGHTFCAANNPFCSSLSDLTSPPSQAGFL